MPILIVPFMNFSSEFSYDIVCLLRVKLLAENISQSNSVIFVVNWIKGFVKIVNELELVWMIKQVSICNHGLTVLVLHQIWIIEVYSPSWFLRQFVEWSASFSNFVLREPPNHIDLILLQVHLCDVGTNSQLLGYIYHVEFVTQTCRSFVENAILHRVLPSAPTPQARATANRIANTTLTAILVVVIERSRRV